MLEPKFYLSNSKNKDFLYNGAFILPDLVNMATMSRSDITIQTAWWKEIFLEVSKKLLEKQRNSTYVV